MLKTACNYIKFVYPTIHNNYVVSLVFLHDHCEWLDTQILCNCQQIILRLLFFLSFMYVINNYGLRYFLI